MKRADKKVRNMESSKRSQNQKTSVDYCCNNLKKTYLHFFLLIMALLFFNTYANDSGKVSVIIPVYNVEKYIRECLDSAINQTYKNLEVICVNDCSTDNSVKIIEEYMQKDARVKIIHHDKNRGAGPARNTGIQNSNGEYIFFLDSDDYLNLDAIELMVKNQKETNADIIVSNTRVFTEDKDIAIENRVKENEKLLKISTQKCCQIGFDNFQYNADYVFGISWGKLYKKDFLIKNNIWHINKNIVHEDGGFGLKTLSNFPLVSFIKDTGINYRLNPYSTTHNSVILKHRTDAKIMLKDFFQYLDQQFEKNVAEKLKELTTESSRYKRFFKLTIPSLIVYWILKIRSYISY